MRLVSVHTQLLAACAGGRGLKLEGTGSSLHLLAPRKRIDMLNLIKVVQRTLAGLCVCECGADVLQSSM